MLLRGTTIVSATTTAADDELPTTQYTAAVRSTNSTPTSSLDVIVAIKSVLFLDSARVTCSLSLM